MAIMIPDQALNVPKYSREDEMFYALKEKLSKEYYVFYSFHKVTVENKKIEESETDFVVFHPQKGILCIEAKNGRITCENRYWRYSSGKPIWNGLGPFEQADKEKWELHGLFKDKGQMAILNNCKFLHAVWLPSYSEKDINNKVINYPSEVDARLTIPSEALVDPTKYIERIYSYDVQKDGIVTNLNQTQIEYIMYDVLAPKFNVVPTMKSDIDLNNATFDRLLDEQKNILNYLEEQKDAVINGVAGSGKTWIAVEKARRCSDENNKTLFICFNRYLVDFLRKNKKIQNVDYYTIDGYVYELNQQAEASDSLPSIKEYNNAVKLVSDAYLEGRYPYKNIIIDEGQDFGFERIYKSKIIETLKTIIRSDEVDGCFYVFYDKLQFVQGKKLPEYIIDADCRMTLYKNCRNTENIAKTSLRPFSDIRKPKLGDMVIQGDSTEMYYADGCEESYDIIQNCIESCERENINDIVILTCAPKVEDSIMFKFVKGDKLLISNKKYTFTTCKKYKGLEADAVILIDITFSMMNSDDVNLFYVGCSRAKNRLFMLSPMSDEQLKEIYRVFKKKKASNNAKKSFATFLNAKYIQL
ncbi:NERD domain-containing protein [Butyrivibrio fibrisolvens]|uniref:nuclease-related domain-containing DEAD/DEAH box helicase n=1 Tax=Pseudobutyrivibrio ruminis TaxID=46206 RepID=UPI000406390F|nr:NERD domain-containing protein [Pseudobutyrivibrio ruminis]MDC7278059.1 NERD domain-containing protein [Butyrivibrio fibrisolvens]